MPQVFFYVFNNGWSLLMNNVINTYMNGVEIYSYSKNVSVHVSVASKSVSE